ncbi:ABC transporter permease [Rugamonas sp. CCM 8940]|uniref:ABC transporter permease n=1 Tax=Rugamonas sp. CCM 8940 TaxID=2765359 RepID=UPI0018F4999E|nr:ABC transporter permease [Rugamonas sp. CCM 8940]MBJ7312511.1 ABC transporter permease [Rugamonas sp. CCM 8940]
MSKPRKSRFAPGFAPGLLAWPALWLLFSRESWWRAALEPLAAPGQAVLFERISLLEAACSHLLIVATAMAGVLLLGVPLAVWATRSRGRVLLPLLSNTVTLGQTLPPVAVLFLATPIFGFGSEAIAFALFTYGLMATVQGTLTGLDQVDGELKRAAEGLGMGPLRRLFAVEIPLALPAILAGVRGSLLLLVATASLAPMVGGVSLGTPIISGLAVNNAAQVMEGAVAVALLAIVSDYSMRLLERRLTPWR